MLNEFKDTKTPSVKPKPRGSDRDRKDKERKEKERKSQDKSGQALVNNGDTTKDIKGHQALMAALATDEKFNLDEIVFFQVGEVCNNVGSPETSEDEGDDDEITVSSGNDDWDFWAEKDEYEHDGGDNIPPLISTSSVGEDNAHATSAVLPENHEEMPSTSQSLQASSPLETEGFNTTVTVHGTSSDGTTLTIDSENNKSNNTASTESRKRKVQPITSTTERGNRAERPDPPGRAPGSKPRSAPCGSLRSAPHTKPRSETVIGVTHRGWTSLAALDLAITEWQSKSFITQRQSYTTSSKIEQMFAQHRGGINPNWILLDSESSVNLIVNETLVDNIRTAPDGYTLTVHCNAGTAVTNKIAELRGFRTVWFYKEGIANIISLGLVTNTHKVTMDSSVDNAMYIHKDDGTIRRFHRGENNLYYYDTRKANSNETLLAITTVEGQKELFSGADRKRAERAYKLQEIVGYPSDKDFLQMIDNKAIQNCTVTRRDIKMARQIYGRNRSSLQGKTVRRQVPHVREDITMIPESVLKNYKHVTLCCDIFHVNGIKFIGTISKHIKFRTARAITNMRKSTLLSTLKTIIGLYESRGLIVKEIFADNQFECIRDDLLQLDNPVTANITASDEHDPFMERSNRTVKERIRCIYSSLPFKRTPIRIILEMVYCAVFWLNSYIPEDGVSATISPRELMTGYSLDANKHTRYQFGEYLMAHADETNNSMEVRADDSIYLRPSGNRQGGFFVFDLSTGRRVHRMHGTPAPMTDSVISRVEEIADAQDAPDGLIFGDSNNNQTMDDFDEAENEDDDNASDGSYNPADDEISVETTLTDTTDTSEISGAIDDRPRAADMDDAPNAVEQIGEDHVNNEDLHDSDEMNENSVATQNDEQDIDGEVDDDNDNTVNDDATTTSIDGVGAEETEGADTIEEESQGRPGLRQTVTRTHNKFTTADGFTTKVLHRGSMFTAGYGRAMDKLTADEVAYIHTASAIAQYNNTEASQVTKQYGVRQGIKIFGDEGVEAVLKELKQIHDRSVVTPIDPAKMTKEMRDKALPYLMFLKRKRCGTVKGRGCADGRRQREFISKEEASSPTVSLHALMISCLIDAIEGRDVATADIPGAFLQTEMPEGEDVYIRLDGTMADLLARLDLNLYEPCMLKQRSGRKVLYAKANKAIYGTLRAALLFWEKLTGTLEDWGFEPNPYDRCTMNKMINGKQATILWHVDDLKISHVDPNVVTDILKDLDKEFGKISPITSTRKKIHDYVGMTIDYTEDGRVKFSMFDYLEEIIQGLPPEFIGTSQTPAADHLFTVDEDGEKLGEEQSDRFHHYVAKLLFMAKRTRPDIGTAIAFLCTRVKEPDVHDWRKLGRVMKYLQATPFLPLTLGWDGTGNVHWYVDASFAVHRDMRSHTGGVMTLGKGAVITVSTKQKINTKSSTEAELVGVDDILNIQVWTRYFIDAQYEHCQGDLLRKRDKIHQDNQSAMKLESNGKASSTKRTRHIDIRYYFITDRVKAGRVDIEYCPTEEMTRDFFTKPLQGRLFRVHRDDIMGVTANEFMGYKDAYNELKRVNKSVPAIKATS